MGEQLEVAADGSVDWVPPSRWSVTRDVPPFGSHQLRYGSPLGPGRLYGTFNPLVSPVITETIVAHLNLLGVTPDGWV
jgi:hypothetical protein